MRTAFLLAVFFSLSAGCIAGELVTRSGNEYTVIDSGAGTIDVPAYFGPDAMTNDAETIPGYIVADKINQDFPPTPVPDYFNGKQNPYVDPLLLTDSVPGYATTDKINRDFPPF